MLVFSKERIYDELILTNILPENIFMFLTFYFCFYFFLIS